MRIDDPTEIGPSEGEIVTIPSGSSWPFAIIAGLLLVVVVNFAFIYIAVSGADHVVPSYVQQR